MTRFKRNALALAVGLALGAATSYAFATGKTPPAPAPAPQPSTSASAGATASAASTATSASAASLKLNAIQLQSFAPVQQFSATTSVESARSYSFSAPSYSNAAVCPIGVLPLIGGTTGAEFCRALYTAERTGDKGPVCRNSWYAADLPDYCEDYYKRHPQARPQARSPFSQLPQ